MLEKESIVCDACDGYGSYAIVKPSALRKAREAAGISLREMARRMDFSPPYLSDVEKGRRRCTALIEAHYETLQPKKGKR